MKKRKKTPEEWRAELERRADLDRRLLEMIERYPRAQRGRSARPARSSRQTAQARVKRTWRCTTSASSSRSGYRLAERQVGPVAASGDRRVAEWTVPSSS